MCGIIFYYINKLYSRIDVVFVIVNVRLRPSIGICLFCIAFVSINCEYNVFSCTVIVSYTNKNILSLILSYLISSLKWRICYKDF